MKNITKYTLFGAAVALTISSCQTDSTEAIPTPDSAAGKTITVAVNASTDPQTKVAVSQGDDIWNVEWKADASDRLGAYSATANSFSEFTNVAYDAEQSSFSGTIDSEATTIRMIHPYDAEANVATGVYNIGIAEQSYDSAEPFGSFGDNVYMISEEAIDVTADVIEAPTMRHLTSGLYINITPELSAAYTLTKVTLAGADGAVLVTEAAVDLEGIYGECVTAGSESGTIEIAVEGVTLEDESASIVAAILPFTLAADQTIAVKLTLEGSNGSEVTATINKTPTTDFEFVCGKYHSLAVAITDEDITPSSIVCSAAGSLDSDMKALFGNNYADTTIEKLTVSGTLNADDFAALQNIKVLDLSEAITALPQEAFGSAIAANANAVLEKITLPNSITGTGIGTFQNCSALTEVVFPTEAEFAIDNRSFFGSAIKAVKLGSNCKQVNYAAFSNCKSLVSFEMEHQTNETAAIGQDAFIKCINLKTVKLPNNVKVIGESAFNGCSQLQEITFPTTLTTFNKSAFNGCKALSKIVIPNSVTTFGVSVFANCDNLTEIEVKWTTTPPAITEYVFPTRFYATGGTSSILIPDGVDIEAVYGANGWEKFSKYQNSDTAAKLVYTVTSPEKGGLAAAMEAEIGADYLTTTIDELTVLGEITAADFASLQNVVSLDLSGVSIVDIDHDNNSNGANIDNALPPYAFNQAKLTGVGKGNTILQKIVLPEVSTIGALAFGGCTALTDMENFVLPKTAYFSLQNRALDLMYLTELNVPSNCLGFSYRGCANNANLETVTIGNINTKGLPNEAFFGCNNITSFEVVWGGEGMNKVPAIVSPNKPLPAIFNAGTGSQSVKIPDGEGVYEAYVAAGWNIYNMYNAQHPRVD